MDSDEIAEQHAMLSDAFGRDDSQDDAAGVGALILDDAKPFLGEAVRA